MPRRIKSISLRINRRDGKTVHWNETGSAREIAETRRTAHEIGRSGIPVQIIERANASVGYSANFAKKFKGIKWGIKPAPKKKKKP
jgi:hypothetical protein